MSSTADYMVNPTPLGEGAYGRVLHARHKATGRDVAIKVIDKVTLRKRRHILQERKWLQQFRDSPWVVTLLASFHDTESAYLALEISTGGDLSQLIMQAHHRDADRNSWHASIPHYGKQVADALSFLHEEMRVVHGDLKPSNILCSAEGQLKLADFDSARSMDENSSEKDDRPLVGTAAYASPELLRGNSNVTTSTAVDMWSLGCVFYALWNGNSPFEGRDDDSDHTIMQRVLAFDGDLPTSIPLPAWSELVCNLLNPNPEQRLKLNDVQGNEIISRDNMSTPPPFLPVEASWQGDSIDWRDGADGWQAFLVE